MTTLLIGVLAACHTGESTAPRPARITASTWLEVGAMTHIEGATRILEIRPDGTTAVGYRSGDGGDAIAFQPGPTIEPDGTFIYHGNPAARLQRDGSVVPPRTPPTDI